MESRERKVNNHKDNTTKGVGGKVFNHNFLWPEFKKKSNKTIKGGVSKKRAKITEAGGRVLGRGSPVVVSEREKYRGRLNSSSRIQKLGKATKHLRSERVGENKSSIYRRKKERIE